MSIKIAAATSSRIKFVYPHVTLSTEYFCPYTVRVQHTHIPTHTHTNTNTHVRIQPIWSTGHSTVGAITQICTRTIHQKDATVIGIKQKYVFGRPVQCMPLLLLRITGISAFYCHRWATCGMWAVCTPKDERKRCVHTGNSLANGMSGRPKDCEY